MPTKEKTLLDAPLSQELIDLLDELIPEKCPKLSDSERDIFHYAGMRQLVCMLKGAWNVQNATAAAESGRKIDRLAGLQV